MESLCKLARTERGLGLEIIMSRTTFKVFCNHGIPQCGYVFAEFEEWYEVEEYIDGLRHCYGDETIDEWLEMGYLIVRE